jgi:hypothetical protein
MGRGGSPPKNLAAEATERREARGLPSRTSAAKQKGLRDETTRNAADLTEANMADGIHVDFAGRDLRMSVRTGDSDRTNLVRGSSEQVQVAPKTRRRILTNQNSSDSEQSGLWRQKDGSVKATVFEGKKARQVIVTKKLSENFDQSKIEPGFLTNQKSRRGRPRNPDMPPVPGQYYYWRRDGNGLSLSYEPPIKNAKGKRIGQGYEYQGFLLPTDWEHLKGKFNEQEVLSKIRAILKIKRFRTARSRTNRGAVAAKRGESGRSAEAS